MNSWIRRLGPGCCLLAGLLLTAACPTTTFPAGPRVSVATMWGRDVYVRDCRVYQDLDKAVAGHQKSVAIARSAKLRGRIGRVGTAGSLTCGGIAALTLKDGDGYSTPASVALGVCAATLLVGIWLLESAWSLQWDAINTFNASQGSGEANGFCAVDAADD